jgi:hypothetical protein
MKVVKKEVTAIKSDLNTLRTSTTSKMNRILDILNKARASQKLSGSNLPSPLPSPVAQNILQAQERYWSASAGSGMAATSGSSEWLLGHQVSSGN